MRVCPVLGDLLAGEGGGQRGEPHAVLGHLVGERGGQLGLGCQLQREVEQVREPTRRGVDGGGEQDGKVGVQQPVRVLHGPAGRVSARVSSASSCSSCSGMRDAGVAGEDQIA